MAPGVPFVPLATVQLVAMAADLGLAVVALTPRWRTRSTPLVVLAGLLLAVTDALTATQFGSGSSDSLSWVRGAAHVGLAVGLLTHALGGRRLVASLHSATSTATSGAVVVPLGAAPLPATVASLGALLAAAATRRVRGVDRWWARLLALGFLGLAVAAALEPAARHSGGAATALLIARALGSLALVGSLARIARGSLLAQVVGASLIGVLLMAIGAVGVGGAVAASVQRQQEQAVGRVAVSELSLLRSQTTSAGSLAAVLAACPDDRRCADVLALFSPLPDDFTAKVTAGGKVLPIGTTRLTFSQRASIAGLPLVRNTLAGTPDTRNGGGTVAAFGTGVALIGAAPITDAAGRIVGAAVYGSQVRDRYAATVHRRSQYDITVLVGGKVAGSSLSPRDAATVTAEARRLNVATRTSLQDRAYTLPALGQRPTIAFTTVTAPDDLLPLAVLAVSQRAGEALRAERKAFTEVFVSAVVVLLLVALVALLIGRRVVRPVRLLTVVAAQVRRGDFSVRAGLTTADEVGRLGRAIDSMTVSLAQSTADLRAAAEEQQAISERLGAVLDSMTEALVVIEGDGRISQANPAAASLLDVPAPQALGLPARELLVITDPGGVPVALTPGSQGEGTLTRRDGTTVPVAYSCAALGGREQRGSVVVLRDTSRDREVERMKTEFLSNVSHELRTPLTPIRGYAEILQRPRGVTDAQRSSYLGTIADSAQRMSRIVDLIVDVAAIDAGKASWVPSEVSVSAWVDERVLLWRKRSPDRAEDLRRRVAARLPAMLVDPVWLAKAVDELVDNALKYTPAGTTVTVFAAASPEGGAVRIGVKDHGPGLEPATLPELFADFRQVDGSATRKVGGLGLGLSFVRRIADAQGLGLVVVSTPRKGAEFALDVPAVKARPRRPTGNRRRARSVQWSTARRAPRGEGVGVSFSRSAGGRTGGLNGPRRPGLLLPAAAVLAVLVLLVVVVGGVYTDLLWFRSVGFSQVLTTTLAAKITLFLVFGSLVGAVVGTNAYVAYRLRPVFRPMSPEQDGLERYRLVVEPRRWIAFTGVALVTGVLAGISASSRWSLWLQWRNGVEFGRQDAQFHRDISYFVFTYPFQRMVLGYLFTAVFLGLLVAALVHYLFGALRVQTPGEKLTPAARAHISVLLGLFVLLKAVAYWLDRYGLAFSPRGIVTGPSYTDVNAVLPAKTILAIVALLCAGMFIANLFFRGWTLPVVSAGVLVLSAVVIGGVYPALVQQFRVKPNESDREAPYIQRMIEATRFAYGLKENVVSSDYAAKTTVQPGQLKGDAETTASIRLLDPNIVTATYDQLQQIRGYYGFAQSLDVDRYKVNGKSVDTVVAVRELDLAGLSDSQDNWINKHLVFTHGFGFVAAPGNALDADGKPLFSERDIPPVGTLGEYEPRIYFGEKSPPYSIVGGDQQTELDRPDERAENGQVNTTYAGKGGVELSGPIRRLLYAAKFREKNVLLSGRISSESKILYIRDPKKRVAKVAPWLKLDSDPYPAIVDGRILWLVDGFTTTGRFPYSQRSQLGDVTADATTRNDATRAQLDASVNYIRNSVKATVDAYDGTVKLYAWDDTDPLLKSWMKVFPGAVKPRSEMSPGLLDHVRYPEDLFKVQRDVLSKYHVTDASAFYGGQDFWVIPKDPSGGSLPQPPYYLTLKMPGQAAPTFSLTASYVPKNRNNLAAFIAVSSDVSDYGTIRVLELPRNVQIDGPANVHNNFQTFPKASTELSLLSRAGSTVELGNLLTLPVGGGLLYVQPVYVKASTPNAYPRLQRVLVEFGDSIAYEPTLSAALDAVFKGSAGVTPPPTTPGSKPPTRDAELAAAVEAVKQAFAEGQAALRAGDLAAYAEAQKRLETAINRLAQIEAARSGASPAPSATSSP